MVHEYKMKKFIIDQLLFFFIGLAVMGYFLFVFRKRIWFGFLLDAIVLLPLLYVCRRLVLLPLDKLLGKKSGEFIFTAKTDAHYLQYHREYVCFEWEFRDEKGKTLRLLIPEATKETSITQPKKDRRVRIAYYRLSRLLMSWEIIE